MLAMVAVASWAGSALGLSLLRAFTRTRRRGGAPGAAEHADNIIVREAKSLDERTLRRWAPTGWCRRWR
jgi:hypothetical protein